MEISDVTTDVNHTLTKLTRAGLKVTELAVHQPTLDDVFLSLTGKTKPAEDKPEDKSKTRPGETTPKQEAKK
jgi:hypothetical protein